MSQYANIKDAFLHCDVDKLMYTIGLDTGRGTLRELTVDELSDADKLPEGAYV